MLGREQAVQPGAFYRVATADGHGLGQVYEDRIYEVTAAGTTDAEQPTYDTTIGNPTTDGTAMLTARDSFMRVAVVADGDQQPGVHGQRRAGRLMPTAGSQAAP